MSRSDSFTKPSSLAIFVRVESELEKQVEAFNETFQSLVEFSYMTLSSHKCRVLGYEIDQNNSNDTNNSDVLKCNNSNVEAFQYEYPLSITGFMSLLRIIHPIIFEDCRLDCSRTEHITATRQIIKCPQMQYGVALLPTTQPSSTAHSSPLQIPVLSDSPPKTSLSEPPLPQSTKSIWTVDFWSTVHPKICGEIAGKVSLQSLTSNPLNVPHKPPNTEKTKLLVQEMLSESNEDDKKHKHWTVRSLIDYEFVEWSNDLFQDYFSESNAYRNFAREPTLAKITNFRRYGKGSKFLFECVFKHPKLVSRNTTNTLSSTRSTSATVKNTTTLTNTLSNKISVWISYNQLTSNPRYQNILKSKYHWSMNEEKEKYDSGCDSEADEAFEQHLDALSSSESDDDKGHEPRQHQKKKLEPRESRLHTKIYCMDSRKPRAGKP